MATGPRDTTSLVMLSGWDATELKNYELQDGTTYATVVGEMNAALGALNAELAGDPLWSAAVSWTDTPEIEYRDGASNGMEVHTEYGRPDAKRAATQGHMLPLLAYDRMLGWTWDYLRKARMSQIEADIADGIKDVRDRYRVSILTRCLQRGDDSGTAKGLGAGGYSPGFCTTAGSTSVDFVPPSVGGTAFLNTHEHYVGITGGAHTAAVFQDVRAELREHGHQAPYDYWTGPTEETTIKALSGFVPVAQMGVNYAATVSTTTFAPATVQSLTGAYFIGMFDEIRIWIVPGVPQYYGFGFKSYGANSARNPLRIRLTKGNSRPQAVAMQNPNAGNGRYPLQDLMLFTEFGVGVNDRTAGTPRYTNSASWSDGTPT